MTLPPQPPVFSSKYLIELHDLMEKHIKAHAEQYGRLCAEAEREACAELMKSQHAWISNVAASRAIRARGTR